MSLAEVEKVLLEELKQHLAVLASRAPAAEVGAEYEGAEECFHAIANCRLLAKADRAGYQRYLIWAALGRRHFLGRCAAEGARDDFRLARSRSEALFCALAAGDLALAAELGRLSPAAPVLDGEYPDDFAYHLFLDRCLSPNASRARDLDDLVAASDPGPRVDACRALVDRDAEGFERALTSLADAYAGEAQARRAAAADVPGFEPRSRLFTEGLALVRLADAMGLPAPGELKLCPKAARVKPLATRPDDLFAELATV